ncbi:MAG: hypothetical protein AB7D37_07540 [Desulfovibrio sp.]
MSDCAKFQIYHEMANENLSRGRYADALAQCDLALSLNPIAPETLYLRALCLHGLGRLQEACEAMEVAAQAGHPQAPQQVAAFQNRIEANERWVRKAKSDWFGYDYGWKEWFLDKIMDFLTK